MKHKKEVHSQITPNCSKFLEGKCKRDSDECWFNHEGLLSKKGFQKVPEKPLPPDQIKQILTVLSQMSTSMESVVMKLSNIDL